MGELRIVAEVEGLDRVLYEESAHWDKCLLSMDDISKAHVEMWESGVTNSKELEFAVVHIKERLHKLVLSLEWTYGRKLQVKVIKVTAPPFDKDTNTAVIAETLSFESHIYEEVKPRKVPPEMPEVPLQAERWVTMWTECSRLRDYVEEQLRRHYLIIEELWDEFQSSFDVGARTDKKRIKLVRNFVSHASCSDGDVIALVEPDLPSAVITVNGKKSVAFLRTTDHRNYVARFEVISRELARSLVMMKMQQLGKVTGV